MSVSQSQSILLINIMVFPFLSALKSFVKKTLTFDYLHQFKIEKV